LQVNQQRIPKYTTSGESKGALIAIEADREPFHFHSSTCTSKQTLLKPFIFWINWKDYMYTV